MPHTPHPPRCHGFRISALDLLILVAGGLGITWLWRNENPLGWMAAIALGHFFLFCNVFLVWRRWELLWAATFIGNVMIHVALGSLPALSVLLWQVPMTILVMVLQIRSPWYHGIWAPRLNPRLNDYLHHTL
ncbi:hypothetical protein [Brevifollis gellanilyticus]|nr:hypothetical protein [Brevifollis gellanilyticus]